MQKEIVNKTLLLDKKGRLINPGYCKRFNYIYNRDQVHKRPFRLKEWNFYQFQKDKKVLQLTIGHVSYMCSVSLALFDLDTGKKDEIGTMKPLFVPKLDLNPEENSFNEYKEKDFYMSFEVKDKQRIITFKGKSKKYEDVECKLILENDINNEKMVIATPFTQKKDQFYLNYKENYYKADGYVRFDEKETSFDNSCGLLDWGRGVWPYKHEWFWGSMTSNIDGVPFGFNIGWGFGDLSNASENMYFYNQKAYKVGKLKVTRNKENYLDNWHLVDDEGNFELNFTPIYDNYTENKYVVIDTHCNQVFGYFEGYIKVDGKQINFENKLAFIEHAVNKW